MVWKASVSMGKRAGCDALSRAQWRAVGGRAGGWTGSVPGLWGAACTVGVRSLAGGAVAWAGQVAHAKAGVLSWLCSHARAVPVLDGARPAGRRGGDRRGVAACCLWAWASTDRGAAGSPASNGPWVAAHSQSPRTGPAGVRHPVGGVSGSSAGRGDCGWQPARRRGRGAHAGCSRVGAALRHRPSLPVGAGGVADRRAAGSLSHATVATGGRCGAPGCGQHFPSQQQFFSIAPRRNTLPRSLTASPRPQGRS